MAGSGAYLRKLASRPSVGRRSKIYCSCAETGWAAAPKSERLKQLHRHRKGATVFNLQLSKSGVSISNLKILSSAFVNNPCPYQDRESEAAFLVQVRRRLPLRWSIRWQRQRRRSEVPYE